MSASSARVSLVIFWLDLGPGLDRVPSWRHQVAGALEAFEIGLLALGVVEQPGKVAFLGLAAFAVQTEMLLPFTRRNFDDLR